MRLLDAPVCRCDVARPCTNTAVSQCTGTLVQSLTKKTKNSNTHPATNNHKHSGCVCSVRFEEGFRAKGFDYVDGCKFVRVEDLNRTRQANLFLTELEILHREHGDEAATAHRIARAKVP